MSGEEFVEGGVTLKETKAFAKRLEERGIDYLSVSAGISETGHNIITPTYLPKGYLLPLAEGIKSVVNVPVLAVGAIHDPYLAEETLQRDRADLIVMGRALLADPELPRKIQSGQLEDIRTCLRCNDGCSSRLPPNKTQRCAVNAEVGRERQMRLHPVSRAKHVCVIGGGPAGMEAARVLAWRGHRVTLVEKENELGGLLRYASVPDFKAEMRSYLGYLQTQVNKQGVEILVNHRATPEFIKELKPDSVVLATGSELRIPDIPGTGKPFVASFAELLRGDFKTGDRVVVAGGAAMGCEIAAHLASAGRKVTLVEMVGEVATDLESRSRMTLLQLLKERGVKILTNWKLEKIENGYVLLVDRDWNKQEISANSVVLAMGLKSNRELFKPLRESFPDIFVIGDCVQPRKVYQAVHEAAFAARAI